MIRFDYRLDFLQALVIAVKQVNNGELADRLNWVEECNIPYIKELVDKINIKKYPELVHYINDICDCAAYTKLFLYLDNFMNLDKNIKLQPFKTSNINDFTKLIKSIYDNEKINEVFLKYSDFLNNFANEFNKNNNFEFKEKLNDLYDTKVDVNFSCNISLLINGGFMSNYKNNVSYVKGVKTTEFFEYFIICLFHEYSHFYVNPIIDKYYDKLLKIEELYEESLENGLPSCYQNKKTMLYEYFVRANSLILSESIVSKLEYDENIEWYKDLGFLRIEDLIDIIKDGINNKLKFEDIYKTICIDYLNNLNFKKIK